MQDLKKEKIIIESAPVKKGINWKILIIILIIVLLLAIFAVISFSVYDSITTGRNETNIIDTNTPQNPAQINPIANNIPANLTNTTGNTSGKNNNSNNNNGNNGGGDNCIPSCSGKQCGSDGCSGGCGSCNASEYCNSTGKCVETPAGCAHDPGCSSAGSFCQGNVPYSCSLGTDGCLDRTNGEECAGYCDNGECFIGNIYYLDAVSGNDNNEGISPSTAWKTLNRALPNYTGTGNKVQGGDTVILAGTPIYVNLTNVQVSPRIDGIKIDDCNNAWSVRGTGVKSELESQDWFPTNTTVKLSINDSFSKNKIIAYKSLPSPITLSGMSNPKLYFWIMQRNSGSLASAQDKIDGTAVELVLCSDTECNNIIWNNTINKVNMDFFYNLWNYITKGFSFKDINVANVGEINAIGLRTTSTWALNYNSTIWIDDISLADGDMHMKLTKPNHGYTFHTGDVAYVYEGINSKAHTKIFEVSSADQNSITLINNLGGEHQFNDTASLYIRDDGYALSFKGDNLNNKWITYRGEGEKTSIIKSLSFGNGDFKDHGDYYLKFENVKFEKKDPGTYVSVYGANNLHLNNVIINGLNGYIYSSISTYHNSNQTKSFTLTNSYIENVDTPYYYSNCVNCKILNNSAKDCTNAGIRLDNNKELLFEGNSLISKGRSSEDWFYNSPHGYGASVRGFDNLTFRNNIISGSFPAGFGYYEEEQKNFIFEGNIIYDLSGGYMIRPNSGADSIDTTIWFRNNTLVCYKSPDNSKFQQSGNMKYLNVQEHLGVSRIENNLILCPFYTDIYSDSIEKNNFIWDWTNTASLSGSSIELIGSSINVPMLENNFFVKANFSSANSQELDYRPLISSVLCNGSLGERGQAFAGALPCVCTQNSQCVEVYGRGSTCNLQTRKCEGGIPTLSPTIPASPNSKKQNFWSWLKSLF